MAKTATLTVEVHDEGFIVVTSDQHKGLLLSECIHTSIGEMLAHHDTAVADLHRAEMPEQS